MLLIIACIACFLAGVVAEAKIGAVIKSDFEGLKAEVIKLIEEVRGTKSTAAAPPAATLPQPDRPSGTAG